MKTLHTDREPANSNPNDIKLDPVAFLEAIKQPPVDLNPAPETPTVTEPKKSKLWLWLLVVVIIAVLIFVIKNYFDKKKELNG